VQKFHKIKIRKSKFGFAKSILSDMNPVGPGWVQVNEEFPIKNHQTRIKKKTRFSAIFIMPKRTVAQKSYSPLGPCGPFGARAAYSRRRAVWALRRSGPVFPPLPEGNLKTQTVICSANLPQHPIPLDRASALARLYTDGCLDPLRALAQ
jgi:hypothetical protein